MANEAELKLFTSRFTPFGQRVAIALKEKKVPFQVINIDYANKPQELLEANPIHKKVPTIIHNGKPVAESLVILEYLEDAFPDQVPLMPKNAFEKSQVRFWTDYIYKALSAIWGVGRAKSGTEKQAAGQEAVNALKTLDAGINSFSADGPFFAGDKFGLLDVALAPIIIGLPIIQEIAGIVIPGSDEIPRLYQWIETVKVHPSVSSILPTVEEAVAYFKVIVQKRAAAEAAAAAQ